MSDQSHEQLLQSKNYYVPNPTITRADLQERAIACGNDLTEELLKYTSLAPEEFDIIHAMLPGLPERRLTIKIGGITYTMTNSDTLYTKVVLAAHDEFFSYPFQLTIKQEREPEAPNDHNEYCPYASSEDWEQDEEGEPFWADEHGHRCYDLENLECMCEWIEVSSKEFTVANDEQWQAVGAHYNGMEEYA
jgi:hypothetical protein